MPTTQKLPIRRRKARNGALLVEKVSISLMPGTLKAIENDLAPGMSLSAWIEDAINSKFNAIRAAEHEYLTAMFGKMTPAERKAAGEPEKLDELVKEYRAARRKQAQS